MNGVAEIALHDLKSQFTQDQLRAAFVARSIDNEFARVGMLMNPRIDYNHFAVWAGYEAAAGVNLKFTIFPQEEN